MSAPTRPVRIAITPPTTLTHHSTTSRLSRFSFRILARNSSIPARDRIRPGISSWGCHSLPSEKAGIGTNNLFASAMRERVTVCAMSQSIHWSSSPYSAYTSSSVSRSPLRSRRTLASAFRSCSLTSLCCRCNRQSRARVPNRACRNFQVQSLTFFQAAGRQFPSLSRNIGCPWNGKSRAWQAYRRKKSKRAISVPFARCTIHGG